MKILQIGLIAAFVTSYAGIEISRASLARQLDVRPDDRLKQCKAKSAAASAARRKFPSEKLSKVELKAQARAEEVSCRARIAADSVVQLAGGCGLSDECGTPDVPAPRAQPPDQVAESVVAPPQPSPAPSPRLGGGGRRKRY